MQVEQAMNEVIEFFSSILICLSFFKTVPIALKGSQVPRTPVKKKKAQVFCDVFNWFMNITELKPSFNKLLTAVSCK